MSHRSDLSALEAQPQQKRPLIDPSVQLGGTFDAVLIAIFLGLTFLLGVFPLKDTDFWWHLKAGDMIRQTGWVPTTDKLTFGAAGHRWVDLHWFFQLLISLGFEWFGVTGLNLAKCLITCLAVSLLVTSGRRGWPVWVTVFAWIPAILVLGGRMYLRPETLTLLYLSIDIAILARWDRHPWLAWGLPVVQMFWVNTQGLFVFGPFLVGVALADAAVRRGAGDIRRRGWWRTTSLAALATGCACLLNPYGLRGAIYPIELLGTMGNPVFKNIGELKPVPTLFAEVGFDSLPLNLHLFLMLFGAISFVIPGLWRSVTWVIDRKTSRDVKLAPKPEKNAARSQKSTKSKPQLASEAGSDYPLWWFRVVVYLTFSGLGLTATRNSHQFAAMVGTVTAWNFAEWVAQIRARQGRLIEPNAISPRRIWPKFATMGLVVLVIGLVGSGQFYAWSREGRTIGLGQEPHWFPHSAIRFAGGPNMPDRLIGYHNGHPSLFEYYWGPKKKVYTDARLEVMGPELYQEYMNLEKRITQDDPGWNDKLDQLGRPSFLVDNLHATNSNLARALFSSRHWRCVWFGPIVSIFVHESYRAVIQDHEVDFLARHFHRLAEQDSDPIDLLAMTKALRGVGTSVRMSAGGSRTGRSMIWLALDYARRLREVTSKNLDGFKQAGLLHFLRDPLLGPKAVPRFRLPFDPTIDLPLVQSAYFLTRSLAIEPDDGVSLYYLSLLDTMRGMDEATLPLLDRYALQPNMNLQQQGEKNRSVEQAAEIRQKLGSSPTTTWANLSELEQLVDRLTDAGRAETAADVIELAHRSGGRPWLWADRLATLRIHLGQPEEARVIWREAINPPSTALQQARVAATYLTEEDFTSARRSYNEALSSDPNLFEAHYGLACVEQASGHANSAVAAGERAEATAPNERSRSLAHSIVIEASPYQQN